MGKRRSKRRNRKSNGKVESNPSNGTKLLLALAAVGAVTSGNSVPINAHKEPVEIAQKVEVPKKKNRRRRRGKSTVPKRYRERKQYRYGGHGQVFQPKRQRRH